MASIREELDAAWAEWMRPTNAAGKRTQGETWRRDNPGEWAALSAYRAGGARPTLLTITGRQMVNETTAWIASSPTVPPPALPFAEAALRFGYATIKVPADQQVIGGVGSPVNGGADCLIDLQGVKRTTGATLIFGGPGQRIHVRNGWWENTEPQTDGSPYWRGGPRIRSSVAGDGPEHVSLTGLLITGSGTADGFAIDAGPNTKVTIQRARVESSFQWNGQSSVEPGEHCDALQIQGLIGRLEVGLSTFFANSVQPPNHGGKCFMLKREGGNGPFTVALSRVNMRGQGPYCGTFLFQDSRDITVTLDEVWLDTENTGAFTWDSGSGTGMLYPNSTLGSSVSWLRSGQQGAYVAEWPSASGIEGQIKQGLPAGGDYMARSSFGY